MAKVSCNDDFSMASIYRHGAGWSITKGIWERSGVIKCAGDYNTFKLPEGQYYISSYAGNGFVNVPEEDALKFSVKSNKINYIGDFKITLTEPEDKPPAVLTLAAPTITTFLLIEDIENFGRIEHLVENNSSQAKTYLQTELPSVYEKYSFVRNMADK